MVSFNLFAVISQISLFLWSGMTQTHTVVGILGHNGRVGSELLQQLTSLRANNITVVVLHRPGSNTSTIPTGIETREIELAGKDGKRFDQAVAGINILLSAVSGTGVAGQETLLPALSRSKDLVTFFPSDLGAVWTEHDYEDTALDFLKAKDRVVDAAHKAGVPLTIAKSGHFAELSFRSPQLGIDAKQNIVNVYKKSQKAYKPIVSIPYIVAGYIDLIKRGATIANQDYHFIEIDTSHAEITEILTELHGEKPKFIEWSDEELHKALNAQPGTALMAAILRKSGQDGWVYPGERVEVPGWKGKSLEEWVKYAAERE